MAGTPAKPAPMSSITAQQFRTLFRRLTTGVALIGVRGEHGPTGMTVNSLTPVSLTPPLLLFCAARASATAKRICEIGRFSVSILTDTQQDVSIHHSGRPLATTTWRWQEINGVPWLEGANAGFLCRLVAEHAGGDHTILVGEIDEMFGPEVAATPLLYHGGKYARLPYEDSAALNSQIFEDLWWTG
jgi:3-hydroxy-9,10-secoandrosta-1,3,5(10)-triene-9,17-dione monooxygenase reductase component